MHEVIVSSWGIPHWDVNLGAFMLEKLYLHKFFLVISKFSSPHRASLEEMRQAAAAQQANSSKVPTISTKNSGLVNNAAPVGVSNPPFMNTV